MTNPQAKIVLSRSQDIPFNKLILSQANVRRVKAGISVEELAEDIAYRGLLQSLNVRPVRDAEGTETGMFEIPAGGRRYRALQLLVTQKRMNKTQPVPCVVRDEGIAEEDSLAENVQRVALHPLDQFRAFQSLRDQGIGEEEIAARFFVTPAVVKQRLKLASVSPKLLDLYAEDEISLEQLMAFTLSSDHARQEQVWEALSRSGHWSPYMIRRSLTESAVSASDRRAQFVGLDAYQAAGGTIVRDLFDEDDEGWLQDPALLDRLVAEKLAREAEQLRGEGWKWIEAAADFPYGHTAGLRRLSGETPPLTDEEQAARDALRAELAELEDRYAGADEYPDEVDARLGEIEKALDAFDERPVVYDPADIARAGVFVSIDEDGDLHIARGYVRPEDRAASTFDTENGEAEGDEGDFGSRVRVVHVGGTAAPDTSDAPEEEDGIKPLPDRLVTELTCHRTLALRDALAGDPDMAFFAVLHALCLDAFYPCASRSCLEISAKSAALGLRAPGLGDTATAKALDARHERWERQLPEDPAALWTALIAFDAASQAALFAHCAALSINAVSEPFERRPGRIAHADQLAGALGLDMAVAGWSPTVDNYLGRVTKARILQAVREAKGDAAAQLIDHLKKPDMAREAERLLAQSGWLPEPLRTPELAAAELLGEDAEPLPAFLAEDGDVDPEASAARDLAAE